LEEVADERRVKDVELGPVEAVELTVKPNLPKLGPKLGKELGAGRGALAGGTAARWGRRPRPASSRSCLTAGSGSPSTSSRRTRCSSSGAGARAGRSHPATAGRARSTWASE